MLTPVKLRSNQVNARAIPESVYPQGDTKCRRAKTPIIVSLSSSRSLFTYFSALDVNRRKRNSCAKEYMMCSAVLMAKFPSTRLAPRFDWG